MRFEVILDIGETPNKCTIAPLEYRSDFKLMRVENSPRLGPFSANSVLLHPEGRCLTELKGFDTIASIDCIWRRLPGLVKRVEGEFPTLARIPEGFVTAYPRKSTIVDADPEGGLATIEAIFVAAAILGNWDPSLFSEYYFGRAFVEANAKRLIELGVREAADPELYPVYTRRPRTSAQRKRDRGREFHPVRVPFGV